MLVFLAEGFEIRQGPVQAIVRFRPRCGWQENCVSFAGGHSAQLFRRPSSPALGFRLCGTHVCRQFKRSGGMLAMFQFGCFSLGVAPDCRPLGRRMQPAHVSVVGRFEFPSQSRGGFPARRDRLARLSNSN